MNPRYSFIPGAFAQDLRADIAHFRVLNLIGRHTDNEGWCRLEQLCVADALGLSGKTVDEKIRDLVEWGYVEKHEGEAGASRGSSEHAIWYRTILDRAVKPGEIAGVD